MRPLSYSLCTVLACPSLLYWSGHTKWEWLWVVYRYRVNRRGDDIFCVGFLPPASTGMPTTPSIISSSIRLRTVLSYLFRYRWWRKPVPSSTSSWLRIALPIKSWAYQTYCRLPRSTAVIMPGYEFPFLDYGFLAWPASDLAVMQATNCPNMVEVVVLNVSGRKVAWLKVTSYVSIEGCG